MRFAPQRHALFRHLGVKKCPKMWCFYHFDLETCFAPQRRTHAYTFSTSQLPKVVRDRQFFTLLTWKRASRTNGVHFFSISTSKSVRTWRVLFCTFWLGNVLRATTACNFWPRIWPAGSAPAAVARLQWIATFLPFRASAFPSLHIVGSLTSKLPSMTFLWGY